MPVLTCAGNSNGEAATTDFVCAVNTCRKIGTFGTGIVSDSSGCSPETVLTSKTNTCRVKCDADNGYEQLSGTTLYTCPLEGGVASTDLVCTGKDCAASIPTGDGFGLACDGLVTDETCTHHCTAGYTDNNNGNGRDYTCPGGTLGGVLLTCTENRCSSFPFTAGMKGAGGDGCVNLVELTAVTDNRCDLACKPGYTSEGVATLSCGIGGGAPSSSFSCTLNECSPYSLPTTGDMQGSDDGDACTNGVVLNAVSPQNTCSLKCRPGSTESWQQASGKYCGDQVDAGNANLEDCKAKCTGSCTSITVYPDGRCRTTEGTCDVKPSGSKGTIYYRPTGRSPLLNNN